MNPAYWSAGSFMDRISPRARQDLLALGVTRPLSSGRRLFTEGGRDTHVEIIRKGFVKVTTRTGGSDQLLAIRMSGDLVGEFAAVAGRRRSATVTACGDIVSTIVRQTDFRQLLNRYPDVAAEVTATVGERLRWANERRADFSAYPVHIRLARVLADIVVSCGQKDHKGLVIGVELTQPELATLIGAAPDTVQRALRTLRASRLIQSGYRRITVLDLAGLRALGDEAPERL
jgi:CRP/FNR family transcriptional regulator, cyclic AMP receptor protein